jgi:hypothetical protein
MFFFVCLVLFILVMALWALSLLGAIAVSSGWIPFIAVLLLACLTLWVGRSAFANFTIVQK